MDGMVVGWMHGRMDRWKSFLENLRREGGWWWAGGWGFELVSWRRTYDELNQGGG